MWDNPWIEDHDNDGLVGVFECDDHDPNTTDLCGAAERCVSDTQCQNGTCEEGACVCEPTFTGPDCLICSAPDVYPAGLCTVFCEAETTCRGHGTCNPQGVCTCDPSWGGTSCDVCANGWFPADECTVFCDLATTCSGNANECDAAGACVCSLGWAGGQCDQCAPDYFPEDDCFRYCQDDTTCSGHGTCSAEGRCICDPNHYPSSTCETFCNPQLSCNGHGSCTNLGDCSCDPGWTGDDCTAYCDAVETCSGHGVCDPTGQCVCDEHWVGLDCGQCEPDFYPADACETYCTASMTCNGNGSCGADGQCVCDEGWQGASCNQCQQDYYPVGACDTYCEAAATCHGRGSCTSDGTCTCEFGWDEPDCAACEPQYQGDECASCLNPLLVAPGCTACIDSTKAAPECTSCINSGCDEVLVSAGTVTLGAPEEEPCRVDGEALHSVTFTTHFTIKTTEVTRGQWAALMNTEPSLFASTPCEECPVDNITWWSAAAYCNALSEEEGLTPCYVLSGCNDALPGEGFACTNVSYDGGFTAPECVGYRLPTEAEWEWAARSGVATSTHLGDVTDCDGADSLLLQIAWFIWNASGQKPQPVASREANLWGLHDMLGNVSEWTGDWHGAFEAVQSPTGPVAGVSRVVRGGSYEHYAAQCRAAWRDQANPNGRYSNLGFRVARSDPGS